MKIQTILGLLSKLEIEMTDFIEHGGVFGCKDLFKALGLKPKMSERVTISGQETKYVNCTVDETAVKPKASDIGVEPKLSSDNFAEIERIFNSTMEDEEASMRRFFYFILRLTLVEHQSEIPKLINKFAQCSQKSGTTNNSIMLKMLSAIGFAPTGKFTTYDNGTRKYHICKRTNKKFECKSSEPPLPTAWKSQIIASLISAARKEVAKCYEGGENEAIVYMSFYYLTERIRLASPDEDARLIIGEFKFVMMQGEMFSDDQSFSTARRNSK